MRTIRVTGKGRIKVHPDMTRITITLEKLCREYAEALERSARETERLKEVLHRYGFDPAALKTLNFEVNTEYESYKVRDEYKRRLAGYKYEHTMKIEFPSDNERLGRILYGLVNSDVNPEFRLSYTVSDPERSKNALLAFAIQDAAQKATVISNSARVELKDIQSIDYSWGEINFEFSPMGGSFRNEDVALSAPMGRYDIDIEPDDIEVTDTVTVVWEIE